MAKSYLESLLSENEKILLITRQHWFILVAATLAEIVFIFLVVIVTSLVGALIPGIFPAFAPIFILAFLVLIIIPTILFLRELWAWLNRQYIVSTRRVMQISGVFNKNVIDSSLEKVNDVKMEQSAFGRIFNYGDIEILTASELGVNLFKKISDPIHFKTTMLNAKVNLEREQAGLVDLAEEKVEHPDDIPAKIEKLDKLRQQGILSDDEFQSKKTELLSKM